MMLMLMIDYPYDEYVSDNVECQCECQTWYIE
jgi:hypothetical protein